MTVELKGPRDDYELAYDMSAAMRLEFEKADEYTKKAENYRHLLEELQNGNFLQRTKAVLLGSIYRSDIRESEIEAGYITRQAEKAADRLDPRIIAAETAERAKNESIAIPVREKLAKEKFAQLTNEETGVSIRLFKYTRLAHDIRYEMTLPGDEYGLSDYDIRIGAEHRKYSSLSYKYVAINPGEWNTAIGIRPKANRTPWLKKPISDRAMRGDPGFTGTMRFFYTSYGGTLPPEKSPFNVERGWQNIEDESALLDQIDVADIISNAKLVGHERIAPTFF